MNDWSSRQLKIVSNLVYTPRVLSHFIHSQNLNNVIIPDIAVPLISRNDKTTCCILEKIQDPLSSSPLCSEINIKPLGTPGKVGVPYLLNYDDKILVVKVAKVSKLFARYRKAPPSSLEEVTVAGTKTCISQFPLNRIVFIASDEFTNETLIAYTLNYMASKIDIPPLYVKHYEGAVCDKGRDAYGLNIMEYCDLGTLNTMATNTTYTAPYKINYNDTIIYEKLVTEDVLYQILSQIVVALDILHKTLEFTSGDLKADNIFVKSDPIDYVYKGIKLQAPFTCKIADYGKSSCMVKRTNGSALRFYNQSTLADIYLKLHPFEPDIENITGEYYYTIGDLTNTQLYTRTRHMGIPYYHSFDYYTVLVSLLTNPGYYYTFFSSERLLKTFWYPVWLNTDESVQNAIYKYVLKNKGRSINDALDILHGTVMKCNAVENVIAAMQ